MATFGKTLGAAVAVVILASCPVGAAFAEPQVDEWFYFKIVPANVITWGSFDAATGEFRGEGVCVDPVVPTSELQVDRDPVTGDLFVLGTTAIYSVDYNNSRCELDELIVSSEFPADEADENVSLRGLSLNDDRSEIDVLWFDASTGDYSDSQIDVLTGAITNTIALDSVELSQTDGQTVTRIDDVLYVASSDNRLWEFDTSSGNQIRVTNGPEGADFPLGLDRSTYGVIHLAAVIEGSSDVAFWKFDPEHLTWSDSVETTYPRSGYTFIEAPPVLASTGVDASGIAVGGAVLLIAGLGVMVRRRARG